MDSGLSYATELGQLVCLAVAVTAGFVAAITYRREREPALNDAAPGPAPSKIVYRDAPTVRIVDQQRVDRRRKIVRLAAGEHIDILETPAGFEPRFRLTLKSLARDDAGDTAHVLVEFGGTHVSCGPLVQELAHNEFKLRRAQRDEPRSSILHYHENNGSNASSLDFMRVKLRSLDVATGTAELDVMQVSGHWPLGTEDVIPAEAPK